MARARRPPSKTTPDTRMSSIDEIADQLYAVPPDEFIAKRDEFVRSAKAEGDHPRAAAVAAFRKPSTGAWLANQLIRERRNDVTALLDLGDALRDAQSRLEGDQLRELSRRRREAVSALVHQARQLAVRLGRPVGDDVGRQLEETLEAALGSPDAAKELEVGRLTTTLQRSGGFAPAAPDLRAVPTAGRRESKPGPAVPDEAAKEKLDEAAAAARAASRELTARINEREAAVAEVASLAARISALTSELADLEEQARAAKSRQQQLQRAVAQAERAVRRANLAVEEAQSHLVQPGLRRT